MLSKTGPVFATLCLLSFAACGSGGGGGSSILPSAAAPGGGPVVPSIPASSAPPQSSTPARTPTPSPISTGTPAPVPTSSSNPSPSPGATPSPIPSGYFAQGTVRDFDTNAAIGGATVVIAPPVYAGATPPPGVSTTATTAADGSFTINPLVAGSNYIEVFRPGFATLHRKLNITSFNNQLGTVLITFLTSDQNNWLAQVNADRATWSAPPVVFDEILVEGARHYANYMAANGWSSTACPTADASCQNAQQYELAQGGTYTASGSNIDDEAPPSSWNAAERRFMAEAARCPAPVNPATCPVSAAPDFLNIVNPSFIWTGLAESPNGKGQSLLNPFLDYYDQEFGTPIHQ